MSSMRTLRRSIPLGTMVLGMVGLARPAAAQVVEQLTMIQDDSVYLIAAIDDSGSSVYSAATTNQFGGNPTLSSQLFRWNAAAPGGAQLATLSGIQSSVSVSDDGGWLAFASTGNPTGANNDASSELFVMRSDGSNLVQLTSDPSPLAGSVYFPMISGDGTRVAFTSNSDYLGTNPQQAFQTYVINRDGTGLLQLSSSNTERPLIDVGPKISDDGQRVVFISRSNLTGGNPDLSSEVYAINADGTGMRQLTSSLGRSEQPSFAGDGNTIAFISSGDLIPGSNPLGLDVVFTINWNGTNLRQVSSGLANAFSTSIVDNGAQVYFSSTYSGISNSDRSFEVFRVNKDGTGLTQITNQTSGVGFFNPTVSGNGTRVVVASSFGRASWGSGRAIDSQLHVMTSTGASPRQITNAVMPIILGADIDSAGNVVYFGSDENLAGLNSSLLPTLWKLNQDGSGATKLATLNDVPRQVSVSATGSTIAFTAIPMPNSADPVLRQEQIWSISGSGAELRRLTNGDSESSAPVIARNGSIIAFTSFDDLDGSEGGGFSPDIFVIRPDGTGLRRITTAGGNPTFDVVGSPSVDGVGAWIVFASYLDLVGQNSDGSREVYRVRTDGTGMQQLTDTPAGRICDEPAVSADGNLVLFHSTADFLGTNPEGNPELFVLELSTSSIRQLTAATTGQVRYVAISDNGQWGFFSSSAPIFEADPDRPRNGYRVRISDGLVERMGGLNLYGGGSFSFMDLAPSPSESGLQVAVVTRGDIAMTNPDGLDELYLVDFTQLPAFSVSRTTPTQLHWQPQPSPARYDVVRGFVASLGPGASGFVDLGPVVCLENDSPDPSTAGFEDAAAPAPGQAFYYLYRGTQGLLAGPGSWGRSSHGSERQPSSGSCAP